MIQFTFAKHHPGFSGEQTVEDPSRSRENMVEVHTRAIKLEEVLMHAITWMNLENIMLSERSQTQKVSNGMIPFIRNIQKRQLHTDRK